MLKEMYIMLGKRQCQKYPKVLLTLYAYNFVNKTHYNIVAATEYFACRDTVRVNRFEMRGSNRIRQVQVLDELLLY